MRSLIHEMPITDLDSRCKYKEVNTSHKGGQTQDISTYYDM